MPIDLWSPWFGRAFVALPGRPGTGRARELPIVDDVAARIADGVCAELSGGEDPARRLHAAVGGVRDEYAGNSPLLWASHQHIGP
ncbi:hypothetical protein ABZ826_24125 [Streptomyces sp. NPDC047515]|uniref:hypothetical protein n=1 Tax=Streptomyces sp. NPDC047515 TaxID=3155380 RepID=UPI0033FCDD51